MTPQPSVADQPRPQHVADHDVFLAPDEAETMRQRWSDIQAAFVDEPRQAVERADGLVDEVLPTISASPFSGTGCFSIAC